jgi:hypothetical protein
MMCAIPTVIEMAIYKHRADKASASVRNATACCSAVAGEIVHYGTDMVITEANDRFAAMPGCRLRICCAIR